MDSPNLSDTMEQERQRLNKVLEAIAEKRAALDQEERATTIELAGIQAYLDAKLGKVMPSTAPVKKRGPTGPRGPRKAGVKVQLLELLTNATGPMKKQDILTGMNATEEKDQQAISNALVALKKANEIDSPERGMYVAVKKDTTTNPPPAAKRVKKEEAQQA